jgi:hypothetical protein
MVDLVAEKIPWLFSSVVVKRSYLDANRELLARETKITDPKIIDIGYEDFRQQTPVNTEPSRAGAESIIAQFPDGVSRNVADYVDTGILDRLRQEGFFAQLEQKYRKPERA